MIKQWLDAYKPKNPLEAEQALREIMQEIALAGLYRSGFFNIAAFYGGTCLRIFYDVGRFSEDLDFSLLKATSDFYFEPFLQGILTEFNALGMQVSVKEKIKTTKNNIDSAFLKSDTTWKELVLENIIPQADTGMRAGIKIKLEVDTKPPLGFQIEEKLLLKPFSFYVKCFTLENLFAGKMHALLFRKWKQRVKGRDWYDMEWFIKRGTPLHLEHFLIRAKDSGDWKEKSISVDEFRQLLSDKISSISFKSIKEDISRFISDDQALEIWSEQYFRDLMEKIKYK